MKTHEASWDRGQFDDDFDFPLDKQRVVSDKYRVNIYDIYLCVSRHLHCSEKEKKMEKKKKKEDEQTNKQENR